MIDQDNPYLALEWIDGELLDKLYNAGKLLDEQPIPTKGRLMWDRETNTVIGTR